MRQQLRTGTIVIDSQADNAAPPDLPVAAAAATLEKRVDQGADRPPLDRCIDERKRVLRGKPPMALATALAFTLSCSGLGKYVWVDVYEEPPQVEKPYVIAPGDVILVRVFEKDQFSTRARVRSDGKISLPLVEEVKAAGLTPLALSSELVTRLREFVLRPQVTVSLEETTPPTIYVIGEVAKPGPYPLDKMGGVLSALSNAGGLTQDACTDCIFVLRQGSSGARIRFAYEALLRPTGKAPAFQLRPGDVVVVE